VLCQAHARADDAGINPYVFSKLEKQKHKWTHTEAKQVYAELLDITATEQFDEEAQSIRIEKLIFNL
jgi:hypothetical protein